MANAFGEGVILNFGPSIDKFSTKLAKHNSAAILPK